jgi:prophage regulatory protein
MPENVNSTDSATPDEAARIRSADFWDADELHYMTGIPASTWRWWARNGEGPPSFKLGKHRLWRRAVVQQWLAKQEQAGN